MKKIATLFVIAIILFSLASGITGTKIAYAGNGLTSKQATQILQKINPHIISYNVDTHEVKYDDGTSVFVTPPNGKIRNGEVTWKYFLEQKGDLRGWLKYSSSEIISRKQKILRQYGKSPLSNIHFKYYGEDGSVPIQGYSQEWCPWCGVAATQSNLSSWFISGRTNTVPTQDQIASNEYSYDGHSVPRDCSCAGNGVSEDAIAYALNGFIFNVWNNNFYYRVTHFTSKYKFWQVCESDVSNLGEPFIACGDTEYLKAWKKHKAWHYTTVYGYSERNYTISYTDSADGLYYFCNLTWYKDIPEYNTDNFDNYYNYAYPCPLVS